MSKGISLGPNTYLGQRIRAPLLKSAPRLTDGAFEGKSVSLKEPRSPSTWVQFGALLHAYWMKFSRGDSLVIKNEKTLLPVHPLWLLSIGLLGRYSKRRDKGRFGSAKGSSTFMLSGSGRARNRSLPFQESPPAFISENFRVPPQGLFSEPMIDHVDREDSGEQEWERRQGADSMLYGVTGSFEAYSLQDVTGGSRLPMVTFILYPAQDPLQLQPEARSLKMLFMLAHGCMQFAHGQYFVLTERLNDDVNDIEPDVSSEELEIIPRRHEPRRRSDRVPYRSRAKRIRESSSPEAYQLSPADFDPSMIEMA